jgi:hypothetical protein
MSARYGQQQLNVKKKVGLSRPAYGGWHKKQQEDLLFENQKPPREAGCE